MIKDTKEIVSSPKKYGMELVLFLLTIIMLFWTFSGFFMEIAKPSYIKEVLEAPISETTDIDNEVISSKQTALIEIERERINRRYNLLELIIKTIGQMCVSIIPSVIALKLKRGK